MAREVRVYTAESKSRRGKEVLKEMISGLARSRYIAYRLAVKDIKSDYSKSAFGMVWDLIDPLVLGLIFYSLMVVKLIRPGDMGMPYAVFVIYGLLLYATWSDCLIMMLGIFAKSRNLLNHLRLPYEALILSVVFRVGFYSIFRIAVMLFFSLVLYYGITPQHLGLTQERLGGEQVVRSANRGSVTPATAEIEATTPVAPTAPAAHPPVQGKEERAFSLPGFFLFLLLYPAIVLSGVAIGLFLAPFDTIYSDVGRLTRIILTPLRYITPVLWTIPHDGFFRYVNHFNPVGPIISDLRWLATHGEMLEATAFFGRCGFYGVLFLIAWFVFHISVPVLAERA
jgi:ABC-type polysaccharide/polyol phosphate export permease